MKIRDNRQKGFSLLELLVVIAIIGILCAILIPNLLDAKDRSKQKATVAEMRNWGTAVSAYHADRGQYPPQPGSRLARDIVNIIVPYTITVIHSKDAFGTELRYYENNVTGSYTVESYGKLGQDGLGVTPDTWQFYELDIVLNDGVFVHSPS